MKKTLHNIMNKISDNMLNISQPVNYTEFEIECGVPALHGEDTSYEEAADGFKQMKDLIGGTYGTNDLDVYEAIAGVIDMAREAKMWQEYAHWLIDKIEETTGDYKEDEYFHLFFKDYEKHQRWDKR